jgi:hypothetical protein
LKRLLVWIAALVVAVMLVVLFVPGVQPAIEAYVLSWLARLAG